MVIIWILYCFEQWSGLKINFHKSSLVIIGKLGPHGLLIPMIFNCRVEKFYHYIFESTFQTGAPRLASFVRKSQQ